MVIAASHENMAHENMARAVADRGEHLPRPVMWTSVSDGLWSCTRDDEFVGSIEFTAGRFEAVDCTGRPLGRSHSLAGAKGIIEGQACTASSDVLTWRNDHRTMLITWAALGVSTVASIALALQLMR